MTDLDHKTPPPVSWPAAKFQPWHGGPCPLCPQEIVTVKTQGGEERTGLAKDFQWVWKRWNSRGEIFDPGFKKASRLNVVGFSPVGGCQKLTGAACQSAQPEGKVELTVVELTMAGKIAAGLVVGFAFYGLSSLLRGA